MLQMEKHLHTCTISLWTSHMNMEKRLGTVRTFHLFSIIRIKWKYVIFQVCLINWKNRYLMHLLVLPVMVILTMMVYQIGRPSQDRKSTRLNSSHVAISYAVFCLKKKKNKKSVRGTLVAQ